MKERVLIKIERWAVRFIRWRHPGSYTVMRTSGEQYMLDNIKQFQGTERS